MSEIEINNCNCIKQAKINIEEGMLNIKYGSNGTGKSTIGQAISLSSSTDNNLLYQLTPYPNDGSFNPEVLGNHFNNVKLFDEKYINQFIFKGQSLFDDSYRVFLKDDRCDELKNDINNMLNDLYSVFQADLSLDNLQVYLLNYINTVNYKDGKINRRGGVGEFIKGNGAGFEKYSELDNYKSYYDRDFLAVSNWGAWRNEGTDKIVGNKCPFCADIFRNDITKQNEIISKVFKKSALTIANKIFDLINEGIQKGYIVENSITVLSENVNRNGCEDAINDELTNIGNEVNYLLNKVDKIKRFKPMIITQEEIIEIENNLIEMRMDDRQIIKFFRTETILSLIDAVNKKIDVLMNKTGKLKGLFIQHDKRLESIISKRKDDINEFFQLAGFPYKFEIIVDGENKASSYLTPVNLESYKVPKPDEHLSWGEKNAFSLVMFMFEALSVNADLIILDDPITSFDKDKKFAVVRRLFDNQKSSFRDKTVLMITHDLQPLIDYVHNDIFGTMGLTTHVIASRLQNENGIITEQSVEKIDLVNTVDFTGNIAQNSEVILPVRIVNYRKNLELTNSDYRNSAEYDVVSNLIHGRTIPTQMDGVTPIDSERLQKGLEKIHSKIPSKTYDDMIQEMNSQSLLSALTCSGQYEKTIIIRLLFERCEGLLTELRREYPAACKFVNESNHVENDYIFQLNPLKYFSIPALYCSELESFLSRNHNKLISENYCS